MRNIPEDSSRTVAGVALYISGHFRYNKVNYRMKGA